LLLNMPSHDANFCTRHINLIRRIKSVIRPIPAIASRANMQSVCTGELKVK